MREFVTDVVLVLLPTKEVVSVHGDLRDFVKWSFVLFMKRVESATVKSFIVIRGKKSGTVGRDH